MFLRVRPTLLLQRCVLLLSSTRILAQPACGATRTSPIRVENATGVGILRAALNCTAGGEVVAQWAGRVPVGTPLAVLEGTFLSITGDDDLAEVNGGASQTNGTRLFEVYQGGSLTLARLKLSGGSAAVGGAIFSKSANLTLNNCVFDGNVATDGGGGAVWADGGAVTIVGGEFSGNNATRYGGAVHAADGSLIVQGESRFEGNTAIGGGALFCGLDGGGSDKPVATCSITGADFVSNIAARESQGSVSDFSYLDGGGAAMFLDASVAISDSVFSANHARLSGGALHGGFDTKLSVSGCIFGNNTSGNYAGAISASSMTLGGGTHLTNNSALDDGGAVLGWDSSGTVTFNDVVCTGNYAGNGGGCFFGTGKGIFGDGTAMIDNSADSGGSIRADDGSDISVNGGNFSGGFSTRGGFLYADDNSRVKITGGVISNNAATKLGGALYCDGNEESDISIEGGTFRDNRALDSGGAISVWGAPGLVTITGGTFEHNEAINHGGFVFVEEGASLRCEGATITGNYAGDQGGGIYARDATLMHCSCDLVANESPQGAAVYLATVKSATFENHNVDNNLALGGSVVYVSASPIVAKGVSFKSSVELQDFSIERAIQMAGNTTLDAAECVFDGWLGDTIILNTNDAVGSLVLDSCDFSRSSATMPVVSPNSDAEIRNAVLSSHTFDNVAGGETNSSFALVDRALDCGDSNACGAGSCVNSPLGVLCECLEDGECLNDSGELFLSLHTPPFPETFNPDPVTFELVVGVRDGTTPALWNLGFEADELDLEVVPPGGVLLPGGNVTVAVTGTPSKQDVGGKVSIVFTLTSAGSQTSASASNTSLEVLATYYLCQADEYAIPRDDDTNGVSCEECSTIRGFEGVDCQSPGATLTSLPIQPGYWRPSTSSSVVFECLQPKACMGTTEVSGPGEYCGDGYTGPYCAVCMEGYGKGAGNTCHYCDDTTVHVHAAMGALFSAVVLLLLLLAVVYLIGGLDAIEIIRQSAGRKRSVVSKSSIVPERNDSKPCAGMFEFSTPNPPRIYLTPESKRCGGESGAGCSRVFKNDCSGGRDLNRAHAGSPGPVIGKAQEVFDLTSTIGPTDARVSARRHSQLSAVAGSGEEGPQENGRIEDGTTIGGKSSYCGFGDTVKQWVSRLPLDKLKILVVVWQILTVFSSITGVEFPESYSKFLSWISVVNLDIGNIFSASCIFPSINFYVSLLVSTLAPLVLVALLVLTYHLAKHRAGIGSAGVIARRAAWSRHVAAVLLLTFLVFTSVSTVVFKTFACDHDVVDGESYLRVDYGLSCNSRLHTFFQVYAGLMILVYPIGIPALYAAILWRNRELLNPRIGTNCNGADESVMTAASTSGDNLSATLCATSNGNTEANWPPRGFQELDEKVKARRDHPELVSSMFLWRDFAPDKYYYEVVECGRRMALTGVLIFIAPRTASQAAMACILAFASILGFELMRPHTDPSNSWLYRLGCVIIFLSNFLALLIKVDVGDEGNRATFGGLLVAVNVLLVVAVLMSSWFTVQQSVDDTRGEDSSSSK